MGSSETPAVASIENASGRSRKLRMVETRDSRSVSTPHFQGNEPTFVARFPEHLTRAPAHQRTDIWGVSDPAGRLGAASARHTRGRSRPFLAATPVLGRLPGGTNRRPLQQRRRRQHRSFQGVATARIWRGSPGGARRDHRAHRSGGPTAPWSSVPLLGPLRPRLLERIDDADTVEVVESWQVFRVERAYTSFHARCDDQGIPQRRCSREMELFRAS